MHIHKHWQYSRQYIHRAKFNLLNPNIGFSNQILPVRGWDVNPLDEHSEIIPECFCEMKAEVRLSLCTQWRQMEEWRYSSTFSQRQYQLEVIDYICEAEYAKTVRSEISLYEKEHRAQLFIVLLQPAHLVGIPIQRSKEILCFPHLCHPQRRRRPELTA
jgi:hypothetical protein